MPSTAGAFNYSEGRPTRSPRLLDLPCVSTADCQWLDAVSGFGTNVYDMCRPTYHTERRRQSLAQNTYCQFAKTLCTHFARECLSLSKGIRLANLRVVYSGLARRPTRMDRRPQVRSCSSFLCEIRKMEVPFDMLWLLGPPIRKPTCRKKCSRLIVRRYQIGKDPCQAKKKKKERDRSARVMSFHRCVWKLAGRRAKRHVVPSFQIVENWMDILLSFLGIDKFQGCTR